MQINLDNVGQKDGYYGYFTQDNFCAVGREFIILKIERQFETNEIFITLCAFYGKRIIRCRVPRNNICSNDFTELTKSGFDINRNSSNVFVSYLHILEIEYLKENAELIFHTGVGWNTITKKNKVTGLSAPLGKAYKSYSHVGNIESKYMGDMDIKPRGTLESQIAFIKKEVIGHTECEAALSIGLSAVVNGLISDIVKTPNIIVHLYGDSSTGKTTAAQLAISCAGLPDMQTTSLMMSWNATPNSIITRLKSNRGMPVAMDEVSKFTGNDISSLIYAISDGRDKDRLNRDATLKTVDKNDSFSTTIISTGEATISGKCKNNTGLRVRVIEISTQFTESAAHADRLKDGSLNNCGYLAPKLAEYMESKGMKYIISKYHFFRDKYVENATSKTIIERVSANYAVILTATELANECFGFSMNIDNILQFFISNEVQNTVERDIAINAHDKLIEFARTNYSHFATVNHNMSGSSVINIKNSFEIFGRIDEGLDKSFCSKDNSEPTKKIVAEYAFTASKFKIICDKLGFEDDKIVLKKLNEAGYLNCEKNKLYRKRKLRNEDSTPTKMYVIYEFQDIEVIDGYTFTATDEDEIEDSPFN